MNDEEGDILASLFSQLNTNDMDELKAQIEILRATLEGLTTRLKVIEKPTIEEYKDEVPTTSKASLASVKALPEFHGNCDSFGLANTYATWRNLVKTTMNYIPKTDQIYLDSLLILKSKIRGPAAAILSNHATPLNFDAIIDRLDFTYADQRAMYVIEQELIVLQQGKMSMNEFYDKVNEKLNTIITKIHMTHKEKIAADTLIDNMREKALRTFITGLSNKLGNVLYASQPKTLAQAYANLQTIQSDRDRIVFATQYNRNERNEGASGYTRPTENSQIRVDNNRKSFPKHNARKHFDGQRNPNFTHKQEQPKIEQSKIEQPNIETKGDPMEVDASSMNVNIDPNKRKFNFAGGSHQYSHRHKQQRINNIETYDDDFGLDDPDYDDETSSQASIFLDS